MINVKRHNARPLLPEYMMVDGERRTIHAVSYSRKERSLMRKNAWVTVQLEDHLPRPVMAISVPADWFFGDYRKGTTITTSGHRLRVIHPAR